MGIEGKDRLQSYEEFWPLYLKEHSKSDTRQLHYLGSGLALMALCGAAVKKDARLLAAIPVAGNFFTELGYLPIVIIIAGNRRIYFLSGFITE